MTFIMTLDVQTVLGLLHQAFQKREEERAYQLYASVYPHFTKNTFKKFSEFYQGQTQPVSTRSSEDILNTAAEILRKAGEKRGTV
jgi:hypothetical protein